MCGEVKRSTPINNYYMDFQHKTTVLFGICLLTRLCFIGKYLDSCDGVDFALGLRDYDLSLHQPHFPGYPVYLFVSRLFYEVFRHEALSLSIPGALFGSLAVYPIALLARRLFSEKTAILSTVFYLVNPLCWLQAERPASDAMGLFFVALSTCFLYRVFDRKDSPGPPANPRQAGDKPPRYGVAWRFLNITSDKERGCLFAGSLALGIGLGVRLSYFPFSFTWMAALAYIAMNKRGNGNARLIVTASMGFLAGVCLWLLPQIGYVGWHSFRLNGVSFLRGHFSDWGGSVATFGGIERVVCMANSLWVLGLGGWRHDSSPLSLIPSCVMIISLLPLLTRLYKNSYFCRAKRLFALQGNTVHDGCTAGGGKVNGENGASGNTRIVFFCFMLAPYTLWVFLGQNVANPRHILPVVPMVLMLIAHGLCLPLEGGARGVTRKLLRKNPFPMQNKGRNPAKSLAALLITSLYLASISVVSYNLVSQYHRSIPAPIRLVQFIERNFDGNATRVYCSTGKRFFDYYLPRWDVRQVRDASDVDADLQSSLTVPPNVLLVNSPGEIKRFQATSPPLMNVGGNSYTDDTKNGLLLYRWNGW